MANHSYKRADSWDRTALCQLGLKFHKQFFLLCASPMEDVGKNTVTLHSPSTMVVLHPAMAAQVTT